MFLDRLTSFIFGDVTLCYLKTTRPTRLQRLCSPVSTSSWQPPDFPVNCFTLSTKWKQAVSLNPVCLLYSSWQCAAVCRLQTHIPLWLWSLRDFRWQRMEHQSIQGWVDSENSSPRCCRIHTFHHGFYRWHFLALVLEMSQTFHIVALASC